MHKKISILRPLVIALSVVALAVPASVLATGESAQQETKSEDKSAPSKQKPEKTDGSTSEMRTAEEPKADTSATPASPASSASPAKDPRCLFKDEEQPQASFNTLEDLYGQLLVTVEHRQAEPYEAGRPAAPQITWREVDPED